MRAPSEYPSTTPPAHSIGEKVHIDILPITTSIGGNNYLLFSVDEKSDFSISIPMPNKSTANLEKALDTQHRTYLSHGHTIIHILSDDENNLKATSPFLQLRQITISTTPRGLKEKKVERKIQTIKSRLSALKASLSYDLPPSLNAEAYLSIIRQSNSLPTTQSVNKSPIELFTGTKPQIPDHPFGTIAVFYHPRDDDSTLKGELGIFISHGYHKRYIKAYLPTRLRIYSMRKMVPLKHQMTPPSWMFKQNARRILPVHPSNEVSVTQDAPIITETPDAQDTQDDMVPILDHEGDIYPTEMIKTVTSNASHTPPTITLSHKDSQDIIPYNPKTADIPIDEITPPTTHHETDTAVIPDITTRDHPPAGPIQPVAT
jgi:hypothetical protein